MRLRLALPVTAGRELSYMAEPASRKPTSIVKLVKKAALEGMSNQEILDLVLKTYPRSRANRKTIAAYRSTLRVADPSIPTSDPTKPRRVYHSWGSTPLGVGDLVTAALKEGASDEEALAMVLRQIPKAQTTIRSVQWYRKELRKADPSFPTNTTVKRERKTSPSQSAPTGKP
jgi:hypothetical protein